MNNKNGVTLVEALIVVAILAILAAFVFGVVSKDGSKVKTVEVETVNIEGCEYIKNHTADFCFVYTHKGNCTNSIHRLNQ